MSKRPPRVVGEIDARGLGRVRGADSHHLVHVQRARPGDRVQLLDARGAAWEGRIERIAPGSVVVRLERQLAGAAGPERILLCGLIRSARWDWLVEKATELGATGIIPLQTERSHRLAPGQIPGKRARWERIAKAACKQSGRPRPPLIEPPHTLRDLSRLELPAARLWLSAATDRSLRQLGVDPELGIALAVGPEGSFTPQEEQQLEGLGFQAVRLGPAILRAETAAIAALAALL